MTLGMAVWPKKGDAITWYNMHRNGWQDKLMAHGGCPVIKGSKWITNKWIRSHQQSLNFPCTNQDAEDERLLALSNDKCSFLPNCRNEVNLRPLQNLQLYMKTFVSSY